MSKVFANSSLNHLNDSTFQKGDYSVALICGYASWILQTAFNIPVLLLTENWTELQKKVFSHVYLLLLGCNGCRFKFKIYSIIMYGKNFKPALILPLQVSILFFFSVVSQNLYFSFHSMKNLSWKGKSKTDSSQSSWSERGQLRSILNLPCMGALLCIDVKNEIE